MRKILFLMILPFVAVTVSAQTESEQSRLDSLHHRVEDLSHRMTQAEDDIRIQRIWGKEKSWNLAYAIQSLKPENGEKVDSKFGISLSRGRNLYFHRKPVAGMVKFGFEYGLELAFTMYKDNAIEHNNPTSADDGSLNLDISQVEIGAFIGPTVAVNPIGNLKAKVFFHIVPSYSMLIYDDDIHGSFVPFLTYGGELTYGRFGFGIERLTGHANYSGIIDDIAGGLGFEDNNNEQKKTKFTNNGIRIYFTFKL